MTKESEKPKVPHKTLDEVMLQLSWWAAKRRPPRAMPTIIWDCKDALEHLKMLKERTEPNHVVMIGDVGHYVSTPVFEEINRLRELDRLNQEAILKLRADYARSQKAVTAQGLLAAGLLSPEDAELVRNSKPLG